MRFHLQQRDRMPAAQQREAGSGRAVTPRCSSRPTRVEAQRAPRRCIARLDRRRLAGARDRDQALGCSGRRCTPTRCACRPARGCRQSSPYRVSQSRAWSIAPCASTTATASPSPSGAWRARWSGRQVGEGAGGPAQGAHCVRWTVGVVCSGRELQPCPPDFTMLPLNEGLPPVRLNRRGAEAQRTRRGRRQA